MAMANLCMPVRQSFAGQVRSIQATPYHHLPGRKCVGCALHHLQGRQYPLLAVSSQRQRLRQLSNILRDSGAVPSTQESSWNSKDTAAAVLVTGTAIGGGFLALPYTTAPSGFVPSFVVMLFSWALLFVQAQVATDLLVEESKGEAVSFAVAAQRRLGSKGEIVISVLFLLLMMTTLVSQYAEAGALFSTLTGMPQNLARLLLSLALAILTWKSPTTRTAAVNGLLTLGFVLASFVVFGTGLPLAHWDRLLRSDWRNYARSFPTILQLFVYLEVTPSIGSLLQLQPSRMKRAIFVGSVLLLILETAWSALGLALVPFHGGLREDPVTVLLRQGGPVASAVLGLGCFAVVTTILGTNLALRSFCRGAKLLPPSWAYSLGVLLPALAPKGAFFAAIDFAGAYPVTLLWGCALPLMALRGQNKTKRKTLLLLALFLASLATVVIYAVQDLGLLLLSRSARWA
ncbi:unnamed protein product [Durusdinium trenchii]|uniref:Uncharacterized protein n=1 Tax=Durusdinium trenchii TaxID=1381693 RepID=A0ABP0NTT6_9DINO